MRSLRYYKKRDAHTADPTWGEPTFFLEVNERGDAERELLVYPNGKVLSYDRAHKADEFGALSIMVVDGDEAWWAPYAISKEDFERKWAAHSPLNRG